jgi:hypothetical protein
VHKKLRLYKVLREFSLWASLAGNDADYQVNFQVLGAALKKSQRLLNEVSAEDNVSPSYLTRRAVTSYFSKGYD